MHYFSLEQPHCEIVSSDWSIMVVGHLLLCLTRCWSLPLPFSLLLKNPNWMMNSRMGAKWNTLSSLVGLKSRKKEHAGPFDSHVFFSILKKNLIWHTKYVQRRNYGWHIFFERESKMNNCWPENLGKLFEKWRVEK